MITGTYYTLDNDKVTFVKGMMVRMMIPMMMRMMMITGTYYTLDNDKVPFVKWMMVIITMMVMLTTMLMMLDYDYHRQILHP